MRLQQLRNQRKRKLLTRLKETEKMAAEELDFGLHQFAINDRGQL